MVVSFKTAKLVSQSEFEFKGKANGMSTHPEELASGLQRFNALGYDVLSRPSRTDLVGPIRQSLEDRSPVPALVQEGKHWVLIVGMDDDQVWYLDPEAMLGRDHPTPLTVPGDPPYTRFEHDKGGKCCSQEGWPAQKSIAEFFSAVTTEGSDHVNKFVVIVAERISPSG